MIDGHRTGVLVRNVKYIVTVIIIVLSQVCRIVIIIFFIYYVLTIVVIVEIVRARIIIVYRDRTGIKITCIDCANDVEFKYCYECGQIQSELYRQMIEVENKE